jgi:hypothetical protein
VRIFCICVCGLLLVLASKMCLKNLTKTWQSNLDLWLASYNPKRKERKDLENGNNKKRKRKKERTLSDEYDSLLPIIAYKLLLAMFLNILMLVMTMKSFSLMISSFSNSQHVIMISSIMQYLNSQFSLTFSFRHFLSNQTE